MRTGGGTVFGYVKAYIPELRVREHEFYRAVYCGLCSSMKKLLGAEATFSLSYDMVFLALCRMAITGDRYDISEKRCCMNPLRLKKRPVMEDGKELRYAASVSALLTKCKLEDDKNDEKGIKRLAASVLCAKAEKKLKKANVPKELEDAVCKKLSELYSLEASHPKTVSEGAEIFGDLLGEIFAFGFENDVRCRRILYEIGRGCGRYIYIIDAVDDIPEDIKKGRYNVMAEGWKNLMNGNSLSDSAKSAVSDAVKLELSRAAGAAELIELPDNGYPETLEILKNILYIGLPKEAERVISGEKKKKEV